MLGSFLRSLALRAPKSGALLLTLLGTALVGTALALVLPAGHAAALDATASVTDSVVVYGPRRFDASASGTVNLERLSFPRVAGRRYIVRVENGATDGSGRVSQGSVKLNGWQIVAGTELSAGVARLERPGVFRGSDTTVVSLTGSTGSYVTLSVLSVADPSVDLFGPVQYTIVQGTSKNHDTTFTAPSNGGPYTLTVLNGDSLGQHRTSSATLTINGVSILVPSNFNQNVGSLARSVTLQASNAFHLWLPGEPEGFVIVRITGTDNVPPVLTISAPANNLLTRDTVVTVSGTVQDQTQTQVTVNGIIAALNGSGVWSAPVPLLTEGSNVLAIRAQDANGLHTDSTRVVKRDTHAPQLTVDGQQGTVYTHDTLVVVTGTATDASAFTVNLNGTPLTVDSLGHFTRAVPLTEGVNVLVVTATDAVGNAATVARTLRRDTQAPLLGVTTPATTVYTRDSSSFVSGTVSDASPTVVRVNGFVAPIDSTGHWSLVIGHPVEGVNVVTVTATDASGLVTTVVRTIIRDTQAPQLTVNGQQTTVYSHDSTFALTGTLTDATPVTLTVNGVAVTADSTGHWSLVVGLAIEGANTVTAVATDAAGNSTTVTRTIIRDTHAPVLTVTSPQPTAYSRDTVYTVSGSATDGSAFTVTVNGVPVTPDSSGLWTLNSALPVEGANLFTVVATDAAGLSTTVTRIVIRDTRAPTLTIAGPQNGLLTQAGSVTISGTVADSTPLTLTVNGTAVTPDASGHWSLVVGLSQGGNVLIALATDAAGNTTNSSVSVTRDSQAPVIALQSPNDGITTTDSSVTVSGTVTDASSASVTVNGSNAPLTGGAFSKSIALAIGSNTITVTATDAAGNAATITRTVTRQQAGPQLPPDPSTVAPALDQTVATNTFTSTQFLYTGANPIQTGVFPGTITLTRAAVVRGAVMSRDGAPLGGVAVSLRGRPEYGQTLSRADGQFDFALNGGGPMVFDFVKAGYLPSQRIVTAEWQQWMVADTVALVPIDTNVTHIDFAQPIQVARGSVVTDSVGTRQGTLMFKQGTTATMVLPNGTTQPLGALDVRISEYTVGSNGRAAMPGELPPATAYTYAAEMSVDAALAAGATSVTFSQPVNYYLDNFRGLPVGTIVPAGWYDRAAGIWRAEPDGRVIKIVAINGGVADISVEASQLAAPQAVLDSLGITVAERTQLATLYPAGKTLWWTPMSHFSSWDLNLGWRFLGFTAGPVPIPLFIRDQVQNPCHCGGSIISVQNQTLGENLSLAGTPYALHYESDLASGYAVGRTLTIPAVVPVDTIPLITGTRNLQRNEAPTSMLYATYHLTVAGRQLVRGPFPVNNIPRTTFTWDGKDAAGRLVHGTQKAKLEMEYWYPATFGYVSATGAAQGRSFGSSIPTTISNAPIFPWPRIQLLTVEMGTRGSQGAGFGGWTLNVHHEYDPVMGELTMGDGTRRAATAIGTQLRNLFALSGHETQILVGPDGKIYTVNAFQFNSTVNRYDPLTGVKEILAGRTTIFVGFAGDGGPATSASMNFPQGLALAPDGTMYIADDGNFRIRKVAPNGIISTIAGNGTNAVSGDGGPAVNAKIGSITTLALGVDGSLYMAEWGNGLGGLSPQAIRRIAPDGIITTVVGGGTNPYPADSTPARNIGLSLVIPKVATGPDGSIYFFHGVVTGGASALILYRMTPDGLLHPIAGHSLTESAATASFTPARKLLFNQAFAKPGLAVDGNGRILVTGNTYVYRISLDGSYEIIAGIGRPRCGTPCDPNVMSTLSAAVATPLESYQALVAPSPDGKIFLLDGGIPRMIENPLPNLGATELLVASEDGSEVYQFTQFGRHLRTLDALTRDTLVEFGYDSAGLVTSVKDADGLVTTFQRTSGRLTSATGPYGQQTTVTNDANGYLHTLTDPAGQSVTLATSASGLLQSLRHSGEGTHTFGFDGLGRLTSDADPSGLVQTLTRTETDTSSTVVLNNDLGRRLTIRVDQLIANRLRTTSTDPAGLTTISTEFENDSSVSVTPDGTAMTAVTGSDTRFGPQSPVLKKATTVLPSGLTSTVTASRTATLSNAADPFSLTSLLDSVSVNGRVFRNLYTRSTRTAVSTSAMGRTSTTIFDASGRVTQSAVPGIDAALFTYDAQGRLQQAKSGGRISTFAYDASGRLLSTTDPLGRKDSLFYDAADRLTRRRLPDGRQVAFSYDSAGNLTSITPPGRPGHGMSYDSAGRLVSYVPPVAGPGAPPSATSYDYNTAKQVTAIHRPDGFTVGFGYDTAGRPSAVSFDRGAITFGYSPSSGNLTSLAAPGGNGLAFTYDGSLPKSVTWSGVVSGSMAVSYSNNFQVTSQTVNGGNAVSYGYDLDGLLTQAGALGIRRDATNGRLVADSVGSQKTTYAYDSHGALLGLVSSVGTDTQMVTAYVRDSLSRITRLVEKVQGVTHDARFTYDTAGRLWTVTRDGVLSATYSYDANGNRLSKVGPGVSEAGVYDDQDRMTSYGTAGYTYGANGELQAKVVGTDTTRYTYDALGNLTHVALPNGTAIDYIIDAQNRRVGKKINGTLVQGFLYQGQLTPVAELDGAGAIVSRFVYASGINVPDFMVKGGVTYRLLRDHLGSVRLVVDVATGTVAQRIDYDEFGVETQNTNPGFQPFGYAGGLTDAATGLVRFGARDYDPVAARWTAKDPIGFAGEQQNLYDYVSGDPINSRDPYGLVGWDDLPTAPDWLVNGVTGFGDGAFKAITFGIGDLQVIRDFLGTGAPPDPCSGVYRATRVVGLVAGSVALSGALASKAFSPGGWLNANQYLRIGFGRLGGNVVFRVAGQIVEYLTGETHWDIWKGGPL